VLPTGFIQDLLGRVDIVEVVGRHVELRKAGINHKGLCPFHGEKTPSFIVSPSRQTYHCFGCGAHGDAIRFLAEHNGLGFMDAVRELAQQAGMAVPDRADDPLERARAAQEREQRTGLTELLARAAAHYRRALKASPRAIEYLKGRGLTGEIAAHFGLGYAPSGWRSLASAFARYDDPQLVEAGLVIVPDAEDGEDPAQQRRYDRFRDRIMFPIRSVRGEVIGFGGRVLDSGEPKYLNSPETAVFHKGQELYGLYEARLALRQRGYALVVEGYMDVVALAQAGYANAVATLGTACTAEHVAKVFRFTDAVIFSFDGDAAGRRAAGRALEAALPHATDIRSIRFLFLPPEHDPDTFVREQGAAAFEHAVAAAVPLSQQLLAHAAQDCNLETAEGRSRMLSQARTLVEQLPDGLLRTQVVSELAQRGGVAVETLTDHWERRTGRATGAASATRTGERQGSPARDSRPRQAMGWRRPPPQTATLLDRVAWLIARHAALLQDLPADDHDLLASQPSPHGEFFSEAERVIHDHGSLAAPAMLDEIAAGPCGSALQGLMDRLRGFHEVDPEDPHATLNTALHRLRLQAVGDELNWLMESGSELSEDASRRMRELLELQATLKRGPASAPG
jgi:DNA primase